MTIAPIETTPYASRGVDVNGLDCFPTGIAVAGVQQPAVKGSVAGGATLTLVEATHNGKIINLDTAAGTIVTLPASTGNGAKYRFRVSVLATTNSHIVKAGGTADSLEGVLFSMDDTSANGVAFAAVAGTDDTITLNRTTTGSVTVGEYFELEDVVSGRFLVRGGITNTGTPATPFSATV